MTTVAEFIGRINAAIVNPLIILLIAIAGAYFLWGMVQFIANSADSQGREEGKRKIIWGIIGMVIMLSVFAILRILLLTFGIPTGPLDSAGG